MDKKEEIDINQLRSSYAVKVAKKQIEAFQKLDEQLKQIMDDFIETIKKRIQK